MKKPITITAVIRAPIQKVWDCWNLPEHITNWAFASEDWHAPKAENDLRVGGKFKTVMAAKDGSAQFDFGGEYTQVKDSELIEYTMDDGRKVKVVFEQQDDGVFVTETFDPEGQNSEEMQRQGWQSVLDNFKLYAENNSQ